jgi:DNA-binding transcriptional LysR family regulator
MDRFASLQVFVACVEDGSMSAAARRLEMSPAMAGKHLRALEDRLGAKLLARTTRRQKLTEVGRAYYDHARQILDQMRLADEGARAARGEARGVLRISAPVNYGSMVLAPVLADFLKAYTGVGVELILDDRYVDLVHEGFDVALRIGRLRSSELVARRLADYRMIICAAPDYLRRAGTPKTPEDLNRHDLLGFTAWTRRGGWALGRDEAPAARFIANNGQALRMAALQGFGLVMQPEALLAADVAAGRLVEVLPDCPPPPAPAHLVYPRDRYALPKLSLFVAFARERLG